MIKVGNKVKGFKYSESEHIIYYAPNMDKYIGKIGSVLSIEDYYFTISFGEKYYFYPLNHPLAKPMSKFKLKLK